MPSFLHFPLAINQPIISVHVYFEEQEGGLIWTHQTRCEDEVIAWMCPCLKSIHFIHPLRLSWEERRRRGGTRRAFGLSCPSVGVSGDEATKSSQIAWVPGRWATLDFCSNQDVTPCLPGPHAPFCPSCMSSLKTGKLASHNLPYLPNFGAHLYSLLCFLEIPLSACKAYPCWKQFGFLISL